MLVTSALPPYLEYFGAAAGPAGLGYYSFPLGDWHAVALNSNIPINGGSGQAAWLRADLTAANSKCTLVYWHHPVFTSGPNGGQRFVRDIWRILYEFNVELVINGHDHLYERFASSGSERASRPRARHSSFTVGTGGTATRVARVAPSLARSAISYRPTRSVVAE